MSEIIMCLALAAWYEARGESSTGKVAVMEVVHNRTKHPNFPNNECDVVRQKGQFSWYKSSVSLVHPPKNYKSSPVDKKHWDETKRLAKNFYTNKTNYTKGSLYFNHKKLGVKYKINTSTKKSYKIGNHVFY